MEARTDWTADELERRRSGYVTEFDAHAARIEEALARARKAHEELHRQARSRYGVTVGNELTKTARAYYDGLVKEVHRRADTAQALGSAITAARQRIASTTETSPPKE